LSVWSTKRASRLDAANARDLSAESLVSPLAGQAERSGTR
jgi:hypothetical protein